MAEKQLRIAIYETPEKIIEGGYGDFYNTLDRKKAIEKMARAGWMATVCAKNEIIPFNVTKEQWDEEWDKLRKYYKKVYYASAEAELDALLGE